MAGFGLGDDNADDKYIKGGTDNTLIGNIGDRLKVSGGIPSLPLNNTIHVPSYLTNGSSSSMTVDGSSTPVEFTWSPPSSQTWYLQTIEMLLIDPGTMDAGDFGSISGSLSNGVLVTIRSQGTLYTIVNLQTNADLSLLFGGGGTGSNSGSIFDSAGFLDSSDIFRGSKAFSSPIILQNSTSDFVKITIRDNLTSLSHFRASINKYRIV